MYVCTYMYVKMNVYTVYIHMYTLMSGGPIGYWFD